MMEAEQMKALIEKARDHKMTPAERFEQRVSFVYSGVSSTTTRDEVRARLAEEYGDPMAYEARITDLQAQLAARDAALERALGVFDWLAENEPDCYGWNPPFPSTSPGIKSEADAIRKMLAARPTNG